MHYRYILVSICIWKKRLHLMYQTFNISAFPQTELLLHVVRLLHERHKAARVHSRPLPLECAQQAGIVKFTDLLYCKFCIHSKVRNLLDCIQKKREYASTPSSNLQCFRKPHQQSFEEGVANQSIRHSQPTSATLSLITDELAQ